MIAERDRDFAAYLDGAFVEHRSTAEKLVSELVEKGYPVSTKLDRWEPVD